MEIHLHICWQCPLLDNFWKWIFTTVNRVLNVELVRDPLIANPGMKPQVIYNMKGFQILVTVEKETTDPKPCPP